MTTSVKTTSIRLFIQVIVLSFMLTLSLFSGYHLFFQKKSAETKIALSDFHQTQSEFEANLSKNLHQMLAQIVGSNAVKVNVHADIDFEEQQITREFLDASEPVKTYKKDEFYGFSKQTTLSSSQGGRIKRLSVAVLLDATQRIYTSEDKANIRALIYSTIGFDSSRGDTLEIQVVPFIQPAFWQKTSTQTMMFILIITILVGFLGLLWIKSNTLSSHVNAFPAIQQPDFATHPETIATANSAAQINGQVQKNILHTVQTFIQEKPNETLTVLRSWLCQEGDDVIR